MSQKYTFQIPNHGVFYAELGQPIPQGYCRELINFIPTENNVQMRNGCSKVVDNTVLPALPYQIASYAFNNAVVQFAPDAVYAVNGTTGVQVLITDEPEFCGGTITSTTETNNRLLVCRLGHRPYVIYWNGTDYVVNEMVINGITAYEDPTGFARYSERLWAYKQGYNQVYFAEISLTFQGNFIEYSVANRFNSRGKLLYLDILGFSAGASVENWLVAVFDSGDIITFNGVQAPEPAPTDFVVTQKITIQQRPTAVRLRYGADLLIVTQEGFQPLADTLQQNGLAKDFILFSPVRSKYLELAALYPVTITGGQDKVLLCFSGSPIALGFKMSSKGWFVIAGWEIQGSTNLLGQIFFLTNTTGNPSNGLYKAFSGTTDNGRNIKATYASDAVDMLAQIPPNQSVGHSIQCAEMQFSTHGTGNFIINAGVSLDFNRPFLSPVIENFSKVVLWKDWNDLLWGDLNGTPWWSTDLQQRFTRVPMGGTAQYVQAVISVDGLYMVDFFLNSQALFFTVNTN